MANASKKHFGDGSRGKKDGSGAMTHMKMDLIGENDILSNRDKSRHSDGRGLDGKAVASDQYRDHSANRQAPVDSIENEFRRD